MARQSEPLFIRNGLCYARWYEGTRRVLLSLGTSDRIEALRRLPIVRGAKMSWDDYQRTTAGYSQNPVSTISGVGRHAIDPPLVVQGTRSGIKGLLEKALEDGWATYKPETGEWVIAPTPGTPLPADGDFVSDLHAITQELQATSNIDQIRKFYRESVLQLYTDKKTAKRFCELWLQFLSENKITSWSQITEKACSDFKAWRLVTPLARSNQINIEPPSSLVVNRHIAFLSKSFDLAVHHGHMRFNPVKFWRPENHQAPQRHGLSRAELKRILNEPVWKHDYLMNGKNKIVLGYTLLDILLLLFVSCKRRGEIIGLNIENISFDDRYVSYLETKNSSKGKSYSIQKAFHISPLIETILKQVIAGRTSGPLFFVPDDLKRDKKATDHDRFNGEYLSELFKTIVGKYAPGKDISLHCLRHTATAILEEDGLNENEIDDTLGHYNVKTALKNYQDRSIRMVAIRLARKTMKGIDVLSKTAEGLIDNT